MTPLVAAVDVGTASVRAAVIDAAGQLHGLAEAPISTVFPEQAGAEQAGAEQDSEEIWFTLCRALTEARLAAGAAPGDIAALGFDATCSLVLRDRAGRPLGLSAPLRDTLAWHDHRAAAEAAECSALTGPVLDHLGGSMSPEMQPPKLMWLCRQRPDLWGRLGYAFDLADFLTWRATGNAARSHCTLTCKWGYLPAEGGFSAPFLAATGLVDLPRQTGIPDPPLPVGGVAGRLTDAAAMELGLAPGLPVATGMIDAHAGALAALGGLDDAGLQGSAALVAGTSGCIMHFAPDPRPMRGVWGPFPDVALPDLWMREAGQSASGGLLNHLCRLWTGAEPTAALHASVMRRIAKLRAEEGWNLGHRLHVLPDFQGNRSPQGDPSALGVLSGLGMDQGFDGLCRVYWRAALSLALGLRQVLDHFAAHGTAVSRLFLVGGQARSPMLADLYATATGCEVHRSAAPNAMLLGGAICAMTAAGIHPDLRSAAAAMRAETVLHRPDPSGAPAIARDYAVFLEMQDQRRRIEAMSQTV
ncbi:FGGY-family carbohydrate kinase [Halodurantibacterium flavum]|uniref:FGGY-family carbohydrate kinase n=1 Tax=Halodurantibacterium flavum TaxID=1382802 RepID=A0ABW4S9G0_9RHOB